VGRTADTDDFMWVRPARKVEKTLNELKRTHLSSMNAQI
jgi:hypothetical protein